MKKYHLGSIENIDLAAKFIIDHCSESNIWVFKGEMGAGKTTLIKAIAKGFGIEDMVSSPTFAIVNEYRNPEQKTFYHFDFYRIDDPEEVLEIGIEEYFYSGNYCWIEWAERIPEYIPEDFMLIEVEVEDDGSRIISLDKIVKNERHG
ncbi:tRNA (adenosine(37)-N6)-threonylcarbamoyltransferase complex ATPase subunit type 1 TsaE [Indibacter alkaliphilus]|uniref:tRNA (adenosine(37)-N6)-threonylcarbamoyltransferase complex ATPase subunit type 1 TsaE n=1 Tax=Indibacter alkaliphilus TaxID=579922 RepID=UPI00028243D7|nr:tRNA (adenosine(37)-N6)-threonylcarbamoyltransferase complex ATPase subunit type 1 TsaE [Indibacter alkaliphilus]